MTTCGHRALRVCVLVLASLGVLVACAGPDVDVDYHVADADDPLTVYVGAGDDRKILQFAVDDLLPDSIDVHLVDATGESNAKIVAGDGDLSFYQHIPAFEADQQEHGYESLSIVSKVNVVPYGLYSAKWTNIDQTDSWVNSGLVSDEIKGTSLPHGSRVVLPATPTGFARGLYLLQSAGLVKLDRAFGGTTAADLTIGQANVVDSSRHLSLVGLGLDDYLESIYDNYDAVVLNPEQASSIGLRPADALVTEPGPDNPYAHVLVAPTRLAGDQRVLELAHVLESRQLAEFLQSTYGGANIAVSAARTGS